MKKLIFLLVTSLFLISSTYALTACENLIADPCFGQEERCEFTVETDTNHDLRAQGGDYGTWKDGYGSNPTRDWVDLREIKNKYTEEYYGSTNIYQYTPCGDDQCDVMPIEHLRMTIPSSSYFEWITWDEDLYGHYASVSDGLDIAGAINVDVREGFLAKFKVCFKNEEADESHNPEMRDFLKRGSYSIIDDYNNDRNPWVIFVDSGQTSGGNNCAIVILDGDEGDYISMDPSDENDDIATFKIDMSKPDGTDWKYETTYDDHDYSGDTEHARIQLLGYENKNYLELIEQCDQEEALEAAEKNRAPSNSNVIINVREGESTNLKLENFPLSGNDQLKNIQLTPKSNSFINSRYKTTKPILVGYSEESYLGYDLGFDTIQSSDLNSYYIDAKDLEVSYLNSDRSELVKIATYKANRVTSHGGSAYSNSKNIYVNITDSNTPISIGNINSIDIKENTNNDKELRSYDLSDFCHDPDSYITYSTPSLTGSSLSNHMPYITKNKLYFYLNDHDTSEITGSIKCKESQYPKSELTVPITINIAEVDEDISVKGSSTLDDSSTLEDYSLGSINFATAQSSIPKYFVIDIVNPDNEKIEVTSSETIQTYMSKVISYSVSEDSVIITYKPDLAVPDWATISINEELLYINFTISDTNSPIRWSAEQIDLPGAIEDTSFEITKEKLVPYYTDEEFDTIQDIILIDTDKEFVSSSSGKLIITPIADNLGPYFFHIKVTDTNTDSLESSPVKIYVEFDPVNDIPIISYPNEYSIEEGIYTVDILEDSSETISINSEDPDGDELTLTISESSNFWSEDNFQIQDNTIIITPTPNYSSQSSEDIYLKVSDSVSESNTLVARINVIPTNDIPTSSDVAAAAYKNTNLKLSEELFEMNDIDGDALSGIELTTLPSSGKLEINGIEITQVPNLILINDLDNLIYLASEEIGYDTFNFRVYDGIITSNSHLFNISIVESPFGENSQLSYKGGVPIPNKQFGDWSCKPGYIPTLSSILQSYTCEIPENEAPVADIKILPEINGNSIPYGTKVYLNADSSYDPEGGQLGYEWSILSKSNTNLTDSRSANSDSKFNFIANNTTCTNNSCLIEVIVYDELSNEERSKSTKETITFMLDEEVLPDETDYSKLDIVLGETYEDNELNYLSLVKGSTVIKNGKSVEVDNSGKVVKYEDLKSRTADGTNEGPKYYEGDGICNKFVGENSINSPEDCEEKSSVFGIVIIFSFISILGILGFVAWKKGLFTKLAKPKASPVTTSYDVPSYSQPTNQVNTKPDLSVIVRTKISQGYSEGEIKNYLVAQGYTEAEIDLALNS